MRLLHEHAVRNKQPMLTCFVDLSKAYDFVDRRLAWQCFESRGMPAKFLKLLRLLHSQTMCAVKGDHQHVDSWFEVCTGFKQWDVNAPILFILFMDTASRDMQPEMIQSGLPYFYRVDGVLRVMPSRNSPDVFWSILFTDEMAIVVPSIEHMQTALQVADGTFSRWALELSLKKAKVMAVGHADPVPAHFSILRGNIKTFSCFRYLGSYFAQDGSIGLEDSHRIKAAACAFHRLQSLCLDRHVKDEVKLRVYQTIVQATLLYACETWAISLDTVSSLEVFQMQCLRRIFRTSRREHVPNAQILARAKMNTVLEMVRFKRLRWLGHLARQADSSLPKRLMHSRLPSKASRGRPPKCWTHYVREDLGASSGQRFMERKISGTPWTHPAHCWKCVID